MTSISPVRPQLAAVETKAPWVDVHVAELSLGGRTLFRDFALSFGIGCWTSILGPSGIGKTSLLRMIGGLQPGARLVAGGEPFAQPITLMAQQDQLLPWLSVIDNALIGYRLRGAPRAERRRMRDKAAALLAELGLGDRLTSLPSTLSGGMRQRVALARTLLEDRPLVLMDEPFSALDAVTRYRMQDLAANLLRGRTVLLVTHSPSEALRLSDRVIVLGGRPVTIQDQFDAPGLTPRHLTQAGFGELEERLLEQLSRSAETIERQT